MKVIYPGSEIDFFSDEIFNFQSLNEDNGFSQSGGKGGKSLESFCHSIIHIFLLVSI